MSAVDEIKSGDLVTVTVKGVRLGATSDIRVTVTDERGELWVLPPTSEVERVAPAEWPPQVGDLWRMRGGSRFVCVRDFDAPGGYEVAMVNVANGSERYMPHELVPVELVYRQDGPQV